MKAKTKPRGQPWHAGMFVHSDLEIEDSRHETCGSPVRSQYLESVPAIVTDETAIVTAKAAAAVDYCPLCDVRVVLKEHVYSGSRR